MNPTPHTKNLTSPAHRVHGAIGFSREYDLQLLTRSAEDARLTFGSPALHRLLVAATIGH